MRLNSLIETLKNIDLSFHLSESEIFPMIPSFLGVQAGQQLNHVTVHVQDGSIRKLPQRL